MAPRRGWPLTGQFKLAEAIAILPVKDMSMFPCMVLPMLVGEKKHMALIDDVVSGDKVVGLVSLKSDTPADQVGSTVEMHDIGIAALILKDGSTARARACGASPRVSPASRCWPSCRPSHTSRPWCAPCKTSRAMT